jgi:hypothetical protein
MRRRRTRTDPSRVPEGGGIAIYRVRRRISRRARGLRAVRARHPPRPADGIAARVQYVELGHRAKGLAADLRNLLQLDVRKLPPVLALVTVQVKLVGVVPPLPSLTVTVTVEVPAVLTVPVVTPVPALIDNPAGRPVAL